ncbi:MAG: anthranilate synthase component I [Candidatus Omnitrophica bacterium]|nr:anthranilate synthase component I [Candidatus Omnitrophota bacterium]
MVYPSLQEFKKLARSANVIPVYKEISADLDTPVSSFLKLARDDYAFLLESVEGQEKMARYSFLGSNPSFVFRSKGSSIEIIDRLRKTSRNFTTASDPLRELQNLMRDFRPAHIKGLPRFYGGFVGYMGYDTVRFFEDIPDKNFDGLDLADTVFMLTDTILVFDHINHTIKIVSNCVLPCEAAGRISIARQERVYRAAVKKIQAIERAFDRPIPRRRTEARNKAEIKLSSNFDKSGFCGIVNKAKDYIRCGDIIQVVLSQRFKAKLTKSAFDVYRSLRSLNPSPYMFFLKVKETTLIGSSPELLVRCEEGAVQTRPIAGTRRRGSNEQEDKKLERDLLSSVKEKAEHLMLVDLGRNDVGRVCAVGTVKVNNFMSVERYSHVMHLVSDVVGRLDRKYTAYDALRACFPAGTVSGSPKVRAMEIIDELENVRRGPYAGCVGYVSFSGNIDTCITIRTICVKGAEAYIQAGAGIVADSNPEKEYQETINKAKALFEALT